MFLRLLFYYLPLAGDVVEGEKEVVMVLEVAGQLHLNLLVEVRRLVVVSHRCQHLAAVTL